MEHTAFGEVIIEQIKNFAFLYNYLTLLSFALFLFMLIRSGEYVILATGCFSTTLSLVNYYTKKHHGVVWLPEDIKNLISAKNVIGSYSLKMSPSTWQIVGLAGCLLGTAILLSKLFRNNGSLGKLSTNPDGKTQLAVGLAGIAMFSFLYISDLSPLHYPDYVWDLNKAYRENGYVVGTINSFKTMLQEKYDMPPGYSAEIVQHISSDKETENDVTQQSAVQNEYPDIILILNETWFDLDYITKTKASADCFENFHALTNAVKGHACVLSHGGGTNMSEYELLTSNSFSLLKVATPFNYITFYEQNSIVNYVESLGYTTMAAHPGHPGSYRRLDAWQELGFDEIYFNDDFPLLEYEGNRNMYPTDASVFESFIQFYKKMPSDRPRLGYLLTIQNHAQWDNNSPEQNTVHSSAVFEHEDVSSQIDEYLTCMKMTDDTIKEMTSYFEELYAREHRKAILCMVGDHGPTFLEHINGETYDAVEDIKKRGTPFFIWANFPIETDTVSMPEHDMIDLVSLTPLTLKLAGIPLSPYYDHITNLIKDAPVFTNISPQLIEASEAKCGWLSPEGQIVSESVGGSVRQSLYDYYYMEYNNIADTDSRVRELFFP